jgi:hypothetical protein
MGATIVLTEFAIDEMRGPKISAFAIGFVLEELKHLAAVHLEGVPGVTVRGRNLHQLRYVVRFPYI